MKFRSEEEIKELLKKFETATIGRDAWKHAEHLVVALCYLSQNDLNTATEKMRAGIFNLLTRGFDVDLSKEMPYHETLTRFWMAVVDRFNSGRPGLSLVDRSNELVELYDKDYPMNFYSRKHLFSERARSEFVEPDLKAFTDEAADEGLPA